LRQRAAEMALIKFWQSGGAGWGDDSGLGHGVH
jgi:hypothetical protein